MSLYLCAHTSPSLAHINQEIELDLPAQSLTQSLIALGRLGQISIVFSSKSIINKKSKALTGNYTPVEAVNELIKDTNLKIVEINSRAIAIVEQDIEEEKVVDTIAKQDKLLEELIILGRRVTGSRILQTDLEGSAPVDIFTREEIDASGSQTMSELFKYIPSVAGAAISTAVSNGGNGTASVTLRALPANNTLVLINGRRVPFEGINGSNVDLNTIPYSSVERLEILKDGASAIYGTDAIAGVVNILMRKEFDGFEFEQYAGTTYKGDLETYKTHFVWGTINDNSAIYLSAEYFDQGPIYSRDRTLSSNADARDRGGIDNRSTATPVSRISFGEDLVYTLIDGEDGDSYLDFAPASEDYLYNYLEETTSTSPSTRSSIYSSGYYEFTENLRLAYDATYNTTSAAVHFAYTPIFTAFEGPIAVSATNIYNPFGYDLWDVRRRVVELGPRIQNNDSENKRFGLTLEGSTSGDTQWDLYVGWGENTSTEETTNAASQPRVARALGPAENCQGADIDGCVPLNLFGPTGSITAEQAAYIRTSDLHEGESDLYSMSGNITTSLIDLPAGPLSIALGFDLRKEKLERHPQNEERIIPSGGGGDLKGERKVKEAYFETHIPVFYLKPGAHSFDIELAARYSNYSDFGENVSPRFGLRYKPISGLLVRGTYSNGFRAPSISELYSEPHLTQLSLVDYCKFPDSPDIYPGCPVQSDPNRMQYSVTVAGNEELEPETSDNTTFGLVWAPGFLEELFISVDHFQINQENIPAGSAQYIIYENAVNGGFSEYIQRNDAGDIIELYSPYFNIGQRKVTGVDTTIRYKLLTYQYGSFTFSLNSTYLDEYSTKIQDDSDEFSIEGTFLDVADEGYGAIPRWKANTGIYWSNNNWELNYTVNYVGDIVELKYDRRIEPWITHDTQLSYQFGKENNYKLSFGIDNLFNESPPFVASAFNDNFDARNYDIRGQYFYGRVRFRF